MASLFDWGISLDWMHLHFHPAVLLRDPLYLAGICGQIYTRLGSLGTFDPGRFLVVQPIQDRQASAIHPCSYSYRSIDRVCPVGGDDRCLCNQSRGRKICRHVP